MDFAYLNRILVQESLWPCGISSFVINGSRILKVFIGGDSTCKINLKTLKIKLDSL
jgi:hypothetical protein